MAGYFGFHQTAMAGEAGVMQVLVEVLKLLILFGLVGGLAIFWSGVCSQDFAGKPLYIALAFALPCLLLTSLGVSRYIFSGNEIDRFFVGYLLLIVTAPFMATVSREVVKNGTHNKVL